MAQFNHYAKYYDLLNSDKDYQSEVNYIVDLIEKNSSNKNVRLLDLGCGTGIHANLFSKLGYQIDGVDVSKSMVDEARVNFKDNPSLNFFENDITSFENSNTYDVVTSLFHVMSYQNSNRDFIKACKTAHNHLSKDGLFIFDFWYGPGVLTTLPEKRVKLLEDEHINVKRIAVPELHINENVVDVNYEIQITDKNTRELQTISEKHSMRYFFIKEIEFYLQHVGFELEVFYEWMTFNVPDEDSWSIVVVAKRK